MNKRTLLPDETQQTDLFIRYARQIQSLVTQVARTNETALLSIESQQVANETIADALTAIAILTEGYITQTQYQSGETINHEPVSVGSLLYETAQELYPYAKRIGVDVMVGDLPKSHAVVMTDRQLMRTAMVSLGTVFMQAAQQTDETTPVVLSAHKSRFGTVLGLYGTFPELNNAMLRRARVLRYEANQPLPQFVSGPAAGLFIAENLLQSVAAKLHVARYRSLNGFATTLPGCNQLQLV